MKRKIAFLFIALFMFEIVSPSMLFALTEGPSSPEFTSFEPVGTTDMVNISSGDFVYNLPVLLVPGTKGGGYPISLSYHSGVTPEKEASWVGFGWTLNPGALNRGLSGIPDDYNDKTIYNFNKSWPIWTRSAEYSAGAEFFSADGEDGEGGDTPPDPNSDQTDASQPVNTVSVSYRLSNSVNNMRGFSVSTGATLGIGGVAAISANLQANELTYDVSVNPIRIFNAINSESKGKVKQIDKLFGKEIETEWVKKMIQGSYEKMRNKVLQGNRLSSYSWVGGRYNSLPSIGNKFRGFALSTSRNLSLQGLPVPIGIQSGGNRYSSVQFPQMTTANRTFGSLHSADYHSSWDNDNYEYGIPSKDIGDEVRIKDFHLDNNTPFDINSQSLPVPKNSYDRFILSGEGLSGDFRFYRHDNGFYSPPAIKSETRSLNAGFELGAPTVLSFGLNIGVIGRSSVQSYPSWWYNNNREVMHKHTDNTPVPKFSGDLGGIRKNRSNYEKESLILDNDIVGNLSLIDNSDPENGPLKQNVADDINNSGKFDHSSSFIEYHTLEEYASNNRFNKNVNSNNILSHSGNQIDMTSSIDGDNNFEDYKESIAEFCVKNKSGVKYVYGLPIYNKNEFDYSTNIGTEYSDGEICFNEVSEKNPLENISNPNIDVLLGSHKPIPYSGTHLLTQILGDNYMDIDSNGPTNDDYGAWTRFDYKEAYGLNSPEQEYYRWRAPYYGMSSSTGQISNALDNMATARYGEKEVYYLDAIETESHIAFFVKNNSELSDFQEYFTDTDVPEFLEGSHAFRLDGLGAELGPNGDPYSELEEGEDNQQNYSNRDDNYQPLEYLEGIVLLSKSEIQSAETAEDINFISITNFEYDNSLVKKVLNNVHVDKDGQLIDNTMYNQSGKLTLKKIWTDYGGVYRAQVSPFEFHYQYPNSQDYPQEIVDLYSRVIDEVDQYGVTSQNPDYTVNDLNAWGSHGYDTENRTELKQNWPSQARRTQPFDPAAWHLKKISLPSGGEIHVQYESDDYQYVQDKRAMALCSLSPQYSTQAYTLGELIYQLNLADLGIVPEAYNSNQEFMEAFNNQLALIKNMEGEKIFFKLLYSLQPGASGSIQQQECSEYVSGYSEVSSVSGAFNGNSSYIKIELKDDENFNPRKAAYYQFLSNNVAFPGDNAGYDGEIKFRCGSVAPYVSSTTGSLADVAISIPSLGAPEVISSYLSPLSASADISEAYLSEVDLNLFEEQFLDESDFGKINLSLSYLKVPLWNPKKGGDVRVKRMMSYSPGVKSDNSDARLFGVEYSYTNKDSSSSGVVSFEPADMRDENPFTEFLLRNKQSALKKLITGKDREQSEGPIAPSLYPSPSLVYSRVVAKNLANVTELNNTEEYSHTGTGFTEYKFHTAHEYPVEFSQTDLSPQSNKDHIRKRRLNIPLGIINIDLASVWATQGFKMERNNMHGQPYSVKSFSGNESETPILISSQETEYYKPGESLPMAEYDVNTENILAYYEDRATEIDVALFKQKIKEVSTDLNVEVDIHVPILPPGAVYPTFAASFGYKKSNAFRHSMTKIIDHVAIPKSVTTYSEGTFYKQENLLFDAGTGDPILVSSNDAYDQAIVDGIQNNGKLYSSSIPAHWIYSDMGQRAVDLNNRNQLTLKAGNIVSQGEDGNPLHGITIGTPQNPSNLTWYSNDGINKNVLNASSVVYDNNNYTNANDIQQHISSLVSSPEILNELNERYLVQSNYTYVDEKTNANHTGNSIHSSGHLSSYTPFDWNNYTNYETNPENHKWKTLEYIDAFDLNGMPVNSHSNIYTNTGRVAIHSSVKYDSSSNQVSAVASNAKYNTVLNENFESSELGSVVSGISHTGAKSFAILGSNTWANSDALIVDDNLISNGLILQFWHKKSSPTNYSQNLNISLNGINSEENSDQIIKIAAVNGWTLYNLEFDELEDYGLAIGDSFVIQISNSVPSADYIDDIRLCPAESSMVTYVYEPNTLRLIATLDDRNFAQLFQYNKEGKLIRKIIETERGLQTIEETQYNSKTKSRIE